MTAAAVALALAGGVISGVGEGMGLGTGAAMLADAGALFAVAGSTFASLDFA